MVASRERLAAGTGAGAGGKRKKNRRHYTKGGRETGEGQIEQANYQQNDDMVE